MNALPAALDRALAELSAKAWRERKAAIERLHGYVRSEVELNVLESLAEHLFDLLLGDQIDARAAAHEVLVTMGDRCLRVLHERLDTAPNGPPRRMLVDLLGQIGDRRHVPRLVLIMDDASADPNLRASAAAGLGRIGGAEAEGALRRLLEDGSEMLRVYALDALRAAKAQVPVEMIEPLVDAAFTRKGSAALLGLSGDAGALPILLPLLDDPMAGVRAEAARSLLELGEGLSARGRPGLVRAAVRRIGATTRANLRDLIGHDDRDVRAAAIHLAGLAGDAEAVAPVLAVMDDPLLQERGLSLVAELGDAAGEALAKAVGQVEPARREHLFRMVTALPAAALSRALLDQMVAALEDPAEEVAQAAAEALAEAGTRAALGGLYRTMANPGRLGETAADAVAAIVMRHGEGHDDLDLLVGSAWPQTGALARNLSRVVGKLRSPAHVPHLVSLLGSPDVGVRVAAAAAVGQVPGDHEGANALSFALADEEAQVRAAACRSLGLLNAGKAVQSLLSATTDPSPMVRAAAVSALVALDSPVALARLRAIIVEDPVPTVVVQAIGGLGHTGLDQDLTMLMSLCTSEDHEVVKAAARALQGFDAHRATAALLGLLSHDRWDVRWAAAEVLTARRDLTALGPLRASVQRETDTLVREVLEDAIAKLEQSQGDAE
ncbi:HEAT repeat domain-containing protein [Paraliomyxa miuraensis]|uniref:HEAT repeat domain-containing protein n=1 Tax=Paraliomyxa miuraensis TaxID=376150 RepID=UPI00225307B3|nr:HEAT repeat domain-containing protein [Paraliomyxa miuraensis]MCX4245787.1 HEAT repeat domain-containing protein [Paraliomyxa miuraensis]